MSILFQRKAWDLNPHDPKVAGLANRSGKPYPATFRICQWTHRESNPDCQSAELESFRWTMSPYLQWTGWESNPSHRLCKSQSPPLEHASPIVRGPRWESSPVSGTDAQRWSLTTEVCCQNTYRPSSDPGWNRTITLLGVIQASSPLDHGIMSVTEAGVEPAKSRGSRPRRFACLRTRPPSVTLLSCAKASSSLLSRITPHLQSFHFFGDGRTRSTSCSRKSNSRIFAR